ncbi:MAG TPA: aminotransferase class I/II-fold pyridoxal phosphate-dependent enzyme [Bryobacteraceae bacterium]|nr:aminotransferase class I/II-fold pyridoxal phosphate-dependent enzyme [Bryobacteraceae bacterium]
MDIPAWPQAGERELELLRAVLESPQWGGFHPFVREFEESFAKYQHAAYGVGAFNGTVTLEAALSLLGVTLGDEVIVPAISFISTATAVSRVGATPVFVDLEPWTFNLDPQCVEEAITTRTRAIIPVHFGGTPCPMDALSGLAARYGVALIEDAAHAQGSEYRGRRMGSFGEYGSFSFQNGKVLSSGEGGMLVTNSEKRAIEATAFINQGRKTGESFYKHFTLGTNFRMTAFQAAVLIAQFEALPDQIARRMKGAALLKSLLSDVEEVVWQEQAPEVTQNSFYLLPGRLRNARVSRDEFCSKLAASGVPCTPFYPFPLYRNPLYQQEESCRITPCPIAEACIEDAFWLSHRVLLAEPETIEQIAGLARAILRKDA